MNILICNIGSSDLERSLLADLRGLSERERAATILADYATWRPRLALPIIGKALRHVQGRPGNLVRVLLIASAQGEEPSDPEEREDWSKDTLFTAQVIQRVLTDESQHWQPIPPECIDIWHITSDPSDYDGVRRFLERRLPELRAAFPNATAYLEVTGGTPAMTTGLLVAGTEVFGAQAEVLYVHPRFSLPQTLNTGRRLQAGPLRAALRSNVAVFAYDAALRAFHEQRAVIGDRLAQGATDVLAVLLQYAACRFNFDLPGARKTLEGGIDAAGDGRWSHDLRTLHAEVDAPDRATQLIEVYHGAVARYRISNYAEFLTQLVRLQENALRLMCIDRGVVFVSFNGQVNPSGALILRAWLNAQPFTLSRDRGNDQRNYLPGRAGLLELLGHLAQQRGEDVSTIQQALNRLNQLAELRNDLTHSLDGVEKRDLAERFAGHASPPKRADEIVPHLRTICCLVTGREPSSLPFDRINTLISSLLHEAV